METFTQGQRVEYFGNAGHVTEILDDGSINIEMDRSRFDAEDGDGERVPKVETVTPDDIGAIKAVELRDMDNYAITAKPGEVIAMSSWGYVIARDGTVYALTRQWVHGIICALLHPDIARKQGYGAPYRGACVYHYQRFELDNQGDFGLVRIAFGMMTPVNVSKGRQAATPEQIDATRRCLLESGLKLNSQVSAELRDMTVSSLLKKLAEADDE